MDAFEEFQKKVQSAIDGKGSPEEQAAKVSLAAWGIEYDRLARKNLWCRSKGNSIHRRGKKRPAPQKKRKK